jgi:hypothetical protein
MAIDKGLYQAPEGLQDEGPGIEIEIEDPEAVHIGIDGLEIDLEPREETAEDFDANLAEYMDESELDSLGSELVDDFEKDMRDRKEWVQTYIEGLKLLGLRYEERTEPWNGACGVFHPMLTESVVRFQAEGITETFPASGPVKTTIIGKETPEKKDSALRVQADMNYQLTEVMTEYRPEHEKMLWNLPITGSAFKKVYFDPSLGRQVAMFIPAEDIVVPYGASSLERAERITHVMRKTENDVLKLIEARFYRDVELGTPTGELEDIEKQKAEEQGLSGIQDDRYRILEMNVDLNLKGFEHKDKNNEETGIALPYVVTIEKGTGKVLAIRRNWYEGDKLHLKRQHFVHYQYIPGFGFYGYGLIHLIGGYAKSATMLIRQLVDAGTLSNLPGGLKTRGLRIKGDDTPIAPGEFRDVDVPGGSIRDNILPLPYKEPSQTLYALFQQIVQEGRQFASSGDMNVSDMSAQAPVGTTLALLERQLKVMGAVQSRMHYSMKQEFKLLKAIIADYAPEDYPYEPEEGSPSAKRSDYDNVDVIPVSDPNASTMAQKVVQYQAALQLAQSAPQLYNLPLLHRQMLEVLGIKNAEKLVPIEDDMLPIDPVQENQNLLTAQPVKAFIQQNHQAHIAVHMSMIQNPKIMQLVQMNPQGQAIMAAAMAHINEHIAFDYRLQVEQAMGIPLPPMPTDSEDAPNVPPQIADQIAMMSAQASQQLMQRDQQQAQQAAAQQQMQDPVVQMQMQELQLRQQDLQLKAQKQAMEAQAKEQQLQIEAARIAAQKEIAAMQVAATSAANKEKLVRQTALDTAKLGVDAAKHREQMAHQRQQQAAQQRHQAQQQAMQQRHQAVQQLQQKTEPKKEKQ